MRAGEHADLDRRRLHPIRDTGGLLDVNGCDVTLGSLLGGTAAGWSIRVPVYVRGIARGSEHREVLYAMVHGVRRTLKRLGFMHRRTAARGGSIRAPDHVHGGVRANEHGEVLRSMVHGARRALERLGDSEMLLAIGALPARATDVRHLLNELGCPNLLLSRERQRASPDEALARKREFLTSAVASVRGLSTTSTLLADIQRFVRVNGGA